jgi:hypothetical protein
MNAKSKQIVNQSKRLEKLMAKLPTRSEMGTRNILANRRALMLVNGIRQPRITYLKVCWNCESTYITARYDSTSCCKSCSQHLLKYRKLGVMPPVKMETWQKEKLKRPLVEEFQQKPDEKIEKEIRQKDSVWYIK